MTTTQLLSKRYVDREKLADFFRTHPDFKDFQCSVKVIDDSYELTVPRDLSEEEQKSVYYGKDTLAQMEAAA